MTEVRVRQVLREEPEERKMKTKHLGHILTKQKLISEETKIEATAEMPMSKEQD